MNNLRTDGSGNILMSADGGPAIAPGPDDQIVYCVEKFFCCEPMYSIKTCQAMAPPGEYWDKQYNQCPGEPGSFYGYRYQYLAGPFLNYCPDCANESETGSCINSQGNCCEAYSIIFPAGSFTDDFVVGGYQCWRVTWNWGDIVVGDIRQAYNGWSKTGIVECGSNIVTGSYSIYEFTDCHGTPLETGTFTTYVDYVGIECWLPIKSWNVYFRCESRYPIEIWPRLSLGIGQYISHCPEGVPYDNGNTVGVSGECLGRCLKP